MSDPADPQAVSSSHWTAFWTFAGTVGVMFLVQFFRYLSKRNAVEAVEGRAVLDNGWRTLFETQRRAHETAVEVLEKRVSVLADDHKECVEGQRALRERCDGLSAQIEVLRVTVARHESVLIVTDHLGVVLTASESAVPFFKRAMNDMVGRTCRDLMDDESWRRHSAAFESGERRPPPRVTAGKAKDSTGNVFDVTVDTRRSFVGADGHWIYVAEISRVKV